MGAETRRRSCYEGAHGMLQRRNSQWWEVNWTTRLGVGGIDGINIQGLGQSWNKALAIGPPRATTKIAPWLPRTTENVPLPTGRAVDYRDMEACSVGPYFYYAICYAH
jgi:hypothetical protein